MKLASPIFLTPIVVALLADAGFWIFDNFIDEGTLLPWQFYTVLPTFAAIVGAIRGWREYKIARGWEPYRREQRRPR